jgi:hypothetical protein
MATITVLSDINIAPELLLSYPLSHPEALPQKPGQYPVL